MSSAGAWRYWLSPAPMSEPAPVAVQEAPPIPPTPENLSELEPVLVEEIAARVRNANDWPDLAEPRGRLGLLYEAHGYSELAMPCYAGAYALEPADPHWRYLWGVLAQKAGDKDAEDAFREVIGKKPDYAPAHERLGLFLLEANAYEEAAEAFEEVIRLRPNEAPGYAGLGRVRLATEQYQEAARLFTKAISLAPNWGLAHYLLAQAYQQLGRLDEARTELARGGRTDPSFVFDPWRSEIAKASVGRIAKLKVASSVLSVGRTAEGVRMLEELLEQHPTDTAVVNNLAVAYLPIKRLDDAERILARALQAHPDEYLTHNNMVAVLLRKGDLDDALAHAEEAVRLAPTIGRAFFGKAAVLARLRRTEEALSAYRRSAELDPSYPRVHSALGETLTQLRRFQEAVEPWETAVKLAPHLWTNQYNLGLAYARVGRLDDAIETLRFALKLSPGNERVQLALDRAVAHHPGG